MQEVLAEADRILALKKYRFLCRDTVLDILQRELHQRGRKRELLKRARRRIHEVWAAYLGEPDYAFAKELLDRAFATGDGRQIRETCLSIMSTHRSSQERSSKLSELYTAVYSWSGEPKRILDLACALHPLAYRWMNLSPQVTYHAYDINRNTMDLIKHYFELEKIPYSVEHRDVLVAPPDPRPTSARVRSMAFLLKMYHCLEHRRRGAGLYLLERITARWIVLSFPTRSLANRAVDIVANYEGQIYDLCRKKSWSYRKVTLPFEVLLLLDKGIAGVDEHGI